MSVNGRRDRGAIIVPQSRLCVHGHAETLSPLPPILKMKRTKKVTYNVLMSTLSMILWIDHRHCLFYIRLFWSRAIKLYKLSTWATNVRITLSGVL